MRRLALALLASTAFAGAALADDIRATGDMGVVVERATGSVLIIDQSEMGVVARVEGLGDLSHASLVFSPDQRYAYVFGRDGGLTQVDLVTQTVTNRVIQGGNSIGGAISDDGTLIAVSNYEPGGVKIFDAATLDLVLDLPTESKTIGLVDAPGRRFVFSMWDTSETWIADLSGAEPVITKFEDVGAFPYDALITADGRRYIVGLFGEDGMTAFDLWDEDPQPQRIMENYGRGEEPLPVYKMPHLEGWALAGDRFVLPAVGRHEVLWVDAQSLTEVGRTQTHGQPIFAVSRPDGRQVWVNYAVPNNDTVEIIDTVSGEIIHTLTPGPGVLHMEFTPRGHQLWLSVRDGNEIHVYDTRTFALLGKMDAQTPSGIFFTARAHRSGL